MADTNAGIDYGMGRANVDPETGIRFGVISQHSISPEAWDYSMQPVYGGPTCPQCGGDVQDTGELDTGHAHFNDQDFYCETCARVWWGDSCYTDEPIDWASTDPDYELAGALDSDAMVLRSPFYTFTAFCSPCVPGAGNLDSPLDGGVKTYALGHDWFDAGRAPYPLYRVADDTEVEAGQ